MHADVRQRVPIGFAVSGAGILLLGETRPELGGSLWALARHGHTGGRPPAVDLDAERRLATVLADAAAGGLLAAAHDLSDGGLAVALAECCLAGTVGAVVALPGPQDAFTSLFSESAARVVVAVRPGAEDRVRGLCADHQVPAADLGRTGGDALTVSGLFRIPLAELAAAHRGPLPSLFS